MRGVWRSRGPPSAPGPGPLIKVPGGSTIKTVGSYDNSPSNRWASEPQKEVYWSEQSWDEMYNGFRVYSVDKNVKKPSSIPQTTVVGEGR